MVSVVTEDWLQGALTGLRNTILAQNMCGSVDGLLAHHALEREAAFPITWQVACDEEWVRKAYNLTYAPHVAALGFSYAATNDPGVKAQLETGLDRLQARDPASGGHLSLSSQPSLMLGLLLGARALGDSGKTTIAWCRGAVRQRSSTSGQASHDDPLFAYIHHVIEGGLVEVPPLENANVYELSLYHWLSRRHITRPLPAETQELIRERLIALLAAKPAIESAPQAAFIWAALYAATLQTLTVTQTSEVSRILQGVQGGLKRWRWDSETLSKPVRWPINSEREVQDILYLVLRPVFSDLVDEETLPKFGHASYASDFGIPSLGLLIEVKYARRAEDFKKVEKEVLEDAIPYLTSTDLYHTMLVLIYDHSASVQEHDITKRALLRIDGIEDVIIMSRPSQLPADQAGEVSRTLKKNS